MPPTSSSVGGRLPPLVQLSIVACLIVCGLSVSRLEAKPQAYRSGDQAASDQSKGGVITSKPAFITPSTSDLNAAGIETSAPTAILIDMETGTVLLDKNADQLTPPASLAKLMTVAVVFDHLKRGRITLDDQFSVSENAWRQGGASSGGSTMFLPLHSRVSVRNLVQGTLIQSGNDATIVLAEGLAGSEEGFSRMMNEHAKAIGITRSTFRNPHGLPDPEQRVTMRDLVTLASYIVRTYPEEYKFFGEQQFTFNGITQHNRNPILGLVEGADGMKTGHTVESGYGLVASAARNGQRIILAMSGLKSAGERRDEARKLLEWGFRGFEQVTLTPAGQTVGNVRVIGGAVGVVPLVAQDAAKVLKAKGTRPDYLTRVVADDQVAAPVQKGRRLGTLQVTANNSIVLEVPLIAGVEVDRGTWWQRAWEGVTYRLRNLI